MNTSQRKNDLELARRLWKVVKGKRARAESLRDDAEAYREGAEWNRKEAEKLCPSRNKTIPIFEYLLESLQDFNDACDVRDGRVPPREQARQLEESAKSREANAEKADAEANKLYAEAAEAEAEARRLEMKAVRGKNG